MTTLTTADFIALLPFEVLGGAIVLLMLVMSFVREHRLTVVLTLAALALTIASVPAALDVLPRQVTPLLAVDRFGLFFGALFAIAAAFTTLLSHRYLDDRKADAHEYYLLLLCATFGAMTTVAASHFATFLLGLETMSIALYALIAYPDEGQPPLEAAAKYLVLSGVASTTMFFGMALVYAATGSMQFDALTATASGADALYVLIGTVLLLGGVAFKLSLVPFHMWTPDVYEGAPSPVSGFLATVSKAAVFAVTLRYLFETSALDSPALVTVLTVLGALSMVIGNLLALMQDNVKRILAYSSIAHVGYLLIALLVLHAVDVRLAAETTMVYFVAYFAMTLAAFGIIAIFVPPATASSTQRHAVAAYEGLFWRQPVLAGAFAAVLLSLAGIPMTVGFIAKFYLFAAGVQGELWLLLWALIVGSAIGIFYYLKIVFAMSKPVPETESEMAPRTGDSTATAPSFAFAGVASIAVLGAVILALGLYPTPMIDLVRAALDGLGNAPAVALGAH